MESLWRSCGWSAGKRSTRGQNRNARESSQAFSCLQQRSGLAALGCVPGNAGDVRAANADIGEFAVAQARQFVQTAVIALPLLDEANECGKHGVLLSFRKFRRSPVIDFPEKIGMFPIMKRSNVALQLSVQRIAKTEVRQGNIQLSIEFAKIHGLGQRKCS